MKGDQIPDSDHVMRYCGGSSCPSGTITAAAFLLRAVDDYVSVNWLEFLKLKTRVEEIAEIRRVLEKKLTLGARAKIAVLNVGKTRQYVLAESIDKRDLFFSHEPLLPVDVSHSGIHNTKSEYEMLVAELIAETIVEEYPAR